MGESDQVLSALEHALRDALATAGQEQVMRALTNVLTGNTVLSGHRTLPGGAQAATQPVELDPDRFRGRVQKVSVSMPEELSLAIRERTGPGGFSRYIAEAADKRLRGELFDEYLDELDRAHGPVSPELMEQARREWPDFAGE